MYGNGKIRGPPYIHMRPFRRCLAPPAPAVVAALHAREEPLPPSVINT